MGIEYREDDDLAFLQYCSEEDISQLASYLIYDKDGEERVASDISSNEEFKLLYGEPDKWNKCWKLVAGELQHFGGDSIVNLFRGKGVLYKELLSDVCEKLKVDFNKKSSAYDIENCLIEKLMEISWGEMSEKEKKTILESLKTPGSSFDAIVEEIQSGGVGSLQWSSWLARSASLAFGYAALSRFSVGTVAAFLGSRSVGLIAAPLAIATMVPMISGVAYRVTIPSVIQVAYVRRKYEQEDRFK